MARNIREQPIRIDLVVGELGNVSMALPLLEEIEIVVPTLAYLPTIMSLILVVGAEVLSRASKGIRLGARGLVS